MPNAPDNIYTGTAQCLSLARTLTWTDAQLVTLDHVIGLLCDEYSSRSHRFDPELFCRIARFNHNRTNPKEIA